jgi:hypothetical protein
LWIDRYRITRRMSEFNRYLSDVGFNLPNAPPIGIGTVRMLGTFTMPALTVFATIPGARVAVGANPEASSITLDEYAFRSLDIVTQAYAIQTFQVLFNTPNSQTPNYNNRVMMSRVYSDYFRFSYLNRLDNFGPPDEAVKALWDIRQKLGVEFTDHSLMYAFKLPDDVDPTADFARYFSTRLLKGVSVMEPDIGLSHPNISSTDQVEELLRKYGLLTTTH